MRFERTVYRQKSKIELGITQKYKELSMVDHSLLQLQALTKTGAKSSMVLDVWKVYPRTYPFFKFSLSATSPKRKRPGSHSHFQNMLPMTGRPPTRPHLLNFPSSPNSIKLGTKPLTCGPYPNNNTYVIYNVTVNFPLGFCKSEQTVYLLGVLFYNFNKLCFKPSWYNGGKCYLFHKAFPDHSNEK